MDINLEALSEELEMIFKEALAEKRYRFGLPTKKGLSNHIASGSLFDSIRAIPGEGEIGIEMNDYGKFVQQGRFPGKKGVPVDALIAWIQERGLTPQNGDIRSMAFAIQTNIKKYGIPSDPGWFDVAIDKIYASKEIEDILGDVTVEALINNLTGI